MLHDIPKRLHYLYGFLQKRLIHLNLQILYTCNFHCKICDFWKEPSRDLPRLSAAQIRIIGAKLTRLGPGGIQYC